MASRRKQSRRNRQKKSKRTRRNCAAYSNQSSFQRGGMAPFEYRDGLLLDQPTRMQAEVAGLDRYIADSQVLAKQAGGRRRSKRKGHRKGKSCRKQRGGSHLADFGGSYELLPAGVARGVNPQFHTEGSVNSMYHEHKGAQA